MTRGLISEMFSHAARILSCMQETLAILARSSGAPKLGIELIECHGKLCRWLEPARVSVLSKSPCPCLGCKSFPARLWLRLRNLTLKSIISRSEGCCSCWLVGQRTINDTSRAGQVSWGHHIGGTSLATLPLLIYSPLPERSNVTGCGPGHQDTGHQDTGTLGHRATRTHGVSASRQGCHN